MGGWNGAVCIASRSMIITGNTIWNAKILTDDWAHGMSQNQISLSWGKLMEQKGYQTYMTGKWHVSIDPQKIFQTVRNIRPGMPKDYWNTEDKKGYDRPKEGKKDTATLPHDVQ